MNSPPASSIPSARTADTRAFVRTSTPILVRILRVAVEIRSGSAGRYPVRSLDQNDADVAVGVDLIEAIRHHLAQALMELGRKLGAGRARADDRDVQLAGADRPGLGLGAQAGVDQAMVESHRLLGGLQRNRELAPRPACRNRWSRCRRR